LQGELRAKGQAGQAVPIGLYKREVGPDGDSFTRMGDYEFVAAINKTNGMFRFLPQLRAEEDKTVSLEIRDLVSGDSMQLKRLSILDGREIPKPLPFRSDLDDGKTGGGVPLNVSVNVSQEMVSKKRQAAIGAIQFAQNVLKQDSNVQSNTRLRKELEEKINSLKNALKSVPASGSTDDRSYQQLANRHTELIVLMRTENLISDEDMKL
jgi:hypothetical protein